MKVPAAKTDAFSKNPDPKARLVLVYGADTGMVRERATLLTRSVVEDPRDPFRVVELDAGELAGDPARLADEAAAITFGGGRRVVWVTGATDTHTRIFKDFLASPAGDALIVVEAGTLTTRSSLRKLCESAENSAALPCYADEGRALGELIRSHMREQGLAIGEDAVAFLMDNLGADRQITRQELSKLTLYAADEGRDPATPITREEAAAVVGDSAALGLDELVNAAADGRPDATDRVAARLTAEGVAAITILRAAGRHLLRIDAMARLVAGGKSPEQAARSLQPPAFGPRASALARQASRWTPGMLDNAYRRLNEAEGQCKTTGMPDQTVAVRTLMALALTAARIGR